ncbi:MAG TPA: AraC family ligand binding domain-containing protein [Bryobacteraceae bacterium]|jgi:mannose-6-phosphate isomerase-like protein (cupin superfamily)
MKKKLWLVAACLLPVRGAEPAQPMFWSAKQLAGIDQSALSKLNPERHLGTERLLDAAFVAFRNGSGEAELHQNSADLILVRSGSGAVRVGGKMTEGRTTAPGEMRGKSVEGDTKYPISAGDMLYIPPNTVHQFWMETGQSFTALVVKLAPAAASR